MPDDMNHSLEMLLHAAKMSGAAAFQLAVMRKFRELNLNQFIIMIGGMSAEHVIREDAECRQNNSPKPQT